MKKFSGYEETRAYSEQTKLPSGGYILKINHVEEVVYSWGSVLKLDFDITDGDFKGFYQKNFDLQVQEDKKWKGSYRLPVPKDDGSEKDGWTKAKFKTVMEAFERSNKGFVWNWDESKLNGKAIGGLFNQKEWNFNDKFGWSTQCAKLVDVQQIKDGTFTIPADEPLKNKEVSRDGFTNIPDGIDEELPF